MAHFRLGHATCLVFSFYFLVVIFGLSCPRFFIILHVNLENKLYYPLMTVNLFSYAQFDFIHSNVLGPSPVSTMKTHSILLFLWMTILVIHEFIL